MNCWEPMNELGNSKTKKTGSRICRAGRIEEMKKVERVTEMFVQPPNQ